MFYLVLRILFTNSCGNMHQSIKMIGKSFRYTSLKGGKKMKKNKKCEIYFGKANLILLGLLMLISGITKFVQIIPGEFLPSIEIGFGGVAGFLASLGFPAAGFFAVLLVLLEVGAGVAILSRWKLNVVKYIPATILTVAILTAHMGDFSGILIRLVLISNYLLLKQK